MGIIEKLSVIKNKAKRIMAIVYKLIYSLT